MKTISDDNRINNYMLLFVVFSDMIYAMMSSLFLLIGLSPKISYYMYYLLFATIFVAFAIKSFYRKRSKSIKVLVLILLILWSVSELYWLVTGQSEIIRQSKTCILVTCITCIPVFIFTVNADDYKLMIDKSNIFVVFTIAYVIIHMIGMKRGLYKSTDYMSFSYSIMPGCIMSFYNGFINKRRLSIIFSLILSLILLVLGSRGVFVAFAISAVLQVLFVRKKVNQQNVIFIAAVLIAMILIVVNYKNIILALYNKFPNSRTLYIFASDVVSGKINLTNRNLYYDFFINNFKNYVVCGIGILRDRYFIGQDVSHITGNQSWLGCYIHNFFLEIIMQFGAIFGTVILCLFVYLLIRSMLNLKYMDESGRILYIMFVPSILVMYMFSGSYLHSMRFYFMLALIIATFSLKKKEILICRK